MEFRILGPLEVRDGEGALLLGEPKQRTLLAVLLLGAGEALSTDRLIDAVWEEEAPATAHKALQLYVSQLRKLLGRERLLTEGGGYRLVVGREEIDARRFERLVEEGKRARMQSDPERAAALLHQALALWRGPALADFAYESFAQGEIARMEELRVAAVEERIEADLARGRHVELAGELEALIAAYPVRERLRGQLMLALYRSGRQAEALEVYQDARSALVKELGIEPSPALRELERAVLDQDPALAPAPLVPTPLAPAAAPPEPATPELAASPPEPAPPEPEPPARKLVTVLFVDVVASGIIAAKLDPERLERVMGRFFDTAAEIVARHGGTVDKFIGDAVTALFGVPRVHEDDAARALRAALDLRAALPALNDELEHDWGVRIAVRTGINTGEVMTGDPRFGRLVTGHEVVVATRLQQAARPGEILVGERTAAAARGAFEFGEPLTVAAKGGEDAPRARRVLRALSGQRPRGVPSAAKVFVGRRAELDLLALTHERVVRSGEPHLVTILGEPGVGKTTLVGALHERLGDAVAWHAGRCLAYGRAATYRPLAEILRDRLGLDETASGDVVLDQLGERRILGLTLGLDPGGGLHPQEARRQLQEAWVELLGELAAESPAVVVIEDLHWALDPLLQLLERAARRASGPLLLLVTARPELGERAPAFTAGAANASQLRLEPLSAEEAASMLAQLAGPLPDDLRALVLDRAEGNPFFLEEALASLIDRGVLALEADGWELRAPVADVPLPDSVQGVIAARIDLLPSAAKEGLQAAAVVGRAFWEGAVDELLDAAPFDPTLLEERGFVRRRRESSLGGERELVFKHALTREVAYGSLPLARRARQHARVAEWLERTRVGPDERAALLAHHYCQAAAPTVADLAWPDDGGRTAELRDRAVRWLRHAADLAIGRYEIAEAVGLLHQALTLARDDAVRVELLLAAARACRLRYDTDGFRATLECALSLNPPLAISGEIYMELARAGSAPELWKEPPPLELVERWTERAHQLADPDSRVEVRALVAEARARPDAGRAALDRALELAERIDNPELTMDVLTTRARVAAATGSLREARQWTDRALALAARIESPLDRDGMLLQAVFDYARAGLLARARELAIEHDALARLSPHQEVHAVASRLIVECLIGAWDSARRLSPRAEAAARANADTPCQFNWRSLLMAALAHAHLADEPNACRFERQALEAVEVSGPAAREPALLRLALVRGDLRTVQRLLAENPGPTEWDVDYAAARLDALAALGDHDSVEREAPPVLERGGYGKPFALRALAAARGDRALRDQAAAAFEALGVAFHAHRTRSPVR
jgi:DNA-binding SARP family transcriptional activator/class 3 adenylate cyclase